MLGQSRHAPQMLTHAATFPPLAGETSRPQGGATMGEFRLPPTPLRFAFGALPPKGEEFVLSELH